MGHPDPVYASWCDLYGNCHPHWLFVESAILGNWPSWEAGWFRLWTRGAKYHKAARRGGLAIHRSKKIRNLQFSHLLAHPNQFMVAVLCSEINWMVWLNGVDIRTYRNFIGESIVSDSSQFLEKNSGLRFYIPLHQSHNIPRHPRWKEFVGGLWAIETQGKQMSIK